MLYIDCNTIVLANFCQTIKLYAKLIQFCCCFIKSYKKIPKSVLFSKSQVSESIPLLRLLVLLFWYIKHPAKYFQGHKSIVIKLILLLKRNKYFIGSLWAFVPFSLASRYCLVVQRHLAAKKCIRNSAAVIEFISTKLFTSHNKSPRISKNIVSHCIIFLTF